MTDPLEQLPRTVEALEPSAEFYIDLSAARAGELLASSPPPQRFVVDGLIPEPVAAAVVAPGSTGKSFFLMQLGAAVATGAPFFGHRVDEPGGVLMLGAEDDRDEMARRLHAIAAANGWADWRDEYKALAENLYLVSRLGQDNRLTEKSEGNVTQRPQWIQAIIDAAREVPNLRLVVLDPTARFRAGDENDNEAATKFVEALEVIRQATGVTVLCAHHSRKGATGDTADEIRGASAFVDALRFAATLAVPSLEQAKKIGLDDDERRKLVRFNIVKSNYRTDADAFWLRRGVGGALEWTEAPAALPRKAQAKNEERYAAALPKLKEVIRKADQGGEPLTRRRLCTEYAGGAGVFGMGDQALRGVITRALDEGEVHLTGEKGDKLRLY